MNKKSAFTLIEVLTVIIIISILIGLAYPKISQQMDEAKKKLTCIQLKTTESALESFYVKNGFYPSNEEGLEILVTNGELKKIPKDPWGSKLYYFIENQIFEIYSLNKDRIENGEAQDIYLKNCE